MDSNSTHPNGIVVFLSSIIASLLVILFHEPGEPFSTTPHIIDVLKLPADTTVRCFVDIPLVFPREILLRHEVEPEIVERPSSRVILLLGSWDVRPMGIPEFGI